jgi:SET domain-containing protein
MYKPLPESLTIRKSSIHGLGVFARKKLLKGIDLGITHVRNENYEHNYIRTPLGGFINHSEDPNVQLIVVEETLHLLTIRDIKRGEEIKLKYHLYGLF